MCKTNADNPEEPAPAAGSDPAATASTDAADGFADRVLPHCWFLTGPTASGKSALALTLARQLDAEIISLDSMAVYRSMDIGTAKPSQEERLEIPHHLIDVADPHEDFSVADFVPRAMEAATDIIGRGRVPLFAGGTGLYLRSVLRGLFAGPEADWSLRRSLQQRAAAEGCASLHAELQRIDPDSAARLHPHDVRRVIRAIEVHRVSGRTLSEGQQQLPRPVHQRPRAAVWLSPARDWLHERINRRVDQMMQQGLLHECRQLLRRVPPPGRTARQALGYRELIDHLEGRCSLESAVERIGTATRQFAKRQHTWFRHLEELTELPITGNESTDALSLQIRSLANALPPL